MGGDFLQILPIVHLDKNIKDDDLRDRNKKRLGNAKKRDDKDRHELEDSPAIRLHRTLYQVYLIDFPPRAYFFFRCAK